METKNSFIPLTQEDVDKLLEEQKSTQPNTAQHTIDVQTQMTKEITYNILEWKCPYGKRIETPVKINGKKYKIEDRIST